MVWPFCQSMKNQQLYCIQGLKFFCNTLYLSFPSISFASLCNTSCQILLHSTISFAKPFQYIMSNIVAFKCEGNWKHNEHFKYLECKHLVLSPFLLNAQNNRKIKRDCKYGSKSRNPKVFIPKFCKCVMQVMNHYEYAFKL